MTHKVLMLIKTSGIAYDDRLRKESLSLRSQGVDVEIAVLEDANIKQTRTVHGDVLCTSVRLRSRRWFSSGAGLVLKVAELSARFGAIVVKTRPNTAWIHNLDLAMLIPLLAFARSLGIIGHIVWDQHELPSDRWLQNPRFMWWFKRLVRMCDHIIMANEERRDFLREEHGVVISPPPTILHNFPDHQFTEIPRADLPSNITAWLAGASYFLAQGGANPKRGLRQLVNAVLECEETKLIVVGPFRTKDITYLKDKHGEILDTRVLFTGYVDQLKLNPYIDHALASVVLYEASNKNSILCAPNRLYQAIARKTPVIVGSNPPMLHLVNMLGNGVVLQSDGSDSADIKAGIDKFIRDYWQFAERASNLEFSTTWESQNYLISSLL